MHFWKHALIFTMQLSAQTGIKHRQEGSGRHFSTVAGEGRTAERRLQSCTNYCVGKYAQMCSLFIYMYMYL